MTKTKNLKLLTSLALTGALVFGSFAANAGVVDAATTSKSTSSSSSSSKSTSSSSSSSSSKTTTSSSSSSSTSKSSTSTSSSTSKTTTSTTSSSSTYKPSTTSSTSTSSSTQQKTQLTQQLNQNTTFNANQKADIQQAINSGILQGVGTKSGVQANLDNQATAAEAAAFLLRSVGGGSTGTSGNFTKDMQTTLNSLGLGNIDASKPVSQTTLNQIAAAVEKKYGDSNLAAFDPKAVQQLASGGLTRGDLLLLSTSTSSTSTPTSSAPKTTTTTTPSSSSSSSSSKPASSSTSSSSSSPSYSAPSYSSPSYSSSSYSSSYTPSYSSSSSSSSSSGGSSYTPAPKPTVTISPATTQLQDTPAEFKANKNAKATVQPNRKYGANVKDQLRTEIINGQSSIDFADKYNNWATKLFSN